MRVTVLSPDLSTNCLGRALVLADILALDHQVRIVGPQFGSEVWPPASDHPVDLVELQGNHWPRFLASVRSLPGEAFGQALVAVKPRFPSLGVALLVRRRWGIPVILDLDDEETALKPIPLHPIRLAGDLLSPDGGISRKVMGPAISRADALTVASSTLQESFGGELILHAKDTDTLSPKPGRRAEWRNRLALPPHPVVLFLGTPRPWKGVEDAARAVQALPFEATFLVVGADETEYAHRLASLPRVRTHPMIPLSHLPGFLEAADLVVIPQRADPITRIQMPSKLFDAMAMARPILATAASDIPRILAEGRGAVVPPGNVPRLTEAMGRILGNPHEAKAMGRRAREWCVKHASLQAARGPMQRSLDKAMKRRGAVSGTGRRNAEGGSP